MPNTIHNVPEKILKLDLALQDLETHPGFQNAQKASVAVINLIGISSGIGFVPLSKVPGTVANQLELAEGYADKRAAYKYSVQDEIPVDIKLFWVQKTSKRTISSLVALTPNFEDETFYTDKNIGIDIVVPHSSDRLFIVLSSSYNIRLVELKGKLTNTQKEIFTKWVQELDFNNKHQIHTILWDSLDLKSLNESFYKGIAGFFSELNIYLKAIPLFDDKSASHFSNRLIGRLIFCWFIRKRGLINETQRYLEISPDEDSSNYYHNRLEILFFSVLNTQVENRIFEDMETPYLNGGLFDPRGDDHKGITSLTFPKDYFHRFFTFLNHYNFTTDESTSDYQQAAIDPEMLGRIFENLLAEQIEETGEQARKAKGAFYTPREIVDYMCRQSIKEYLKSQLADEEGIEQVISDLMDTKEHAYDKNVREKITTYKQKLITALDNVKIIDPACGSGAFPMGMLKLLEHLYERIDVRYEPYETKLEIIKNNLFGVDIEPMAIEISRLRAWLSIIVDTDINPSKFNKGIEPLPNLDFKFLCANSLIGLELKPKKEQLSLGSNIVGDDELINKLRDLRNEWFDPKDRTKKQIKDEFENVQHKLFDSVLKDWNGTASREDKLKLVDWDPFFDKPADFFDPFWMFGIKSGFDIVLGNPPYGAKLTKNEKDFYKIEYADVHMRTPDSLNYFISKSLRILNKNTNSILSFIVSNNLLFQNEYVKTRELLFKNNKVLIIINLGDQVFESAIVPSCIFLVQNRSENEYDYKFADLRSHRKDLININFNSLLKSYTKRDILITPAYVLGIDKSSIDIIKKVESLSRKIDDIAEEMASGISTGGDKIFRVSNKTIQEYFLEKDLLRNVLIGREMQEYWVGSSNHSIIYTTRETDINKYPNIKKYLMQYKDKLSLRSECKDGILPWYSLNRQRYSLLFEDNKIIFRQTSDCVRAAYDQNGYYVLNSILILKLTESCGYDYKFVLGILNSKLTNYIYQKISQEGGRIFAEVKPINIRKLYLPNIKKNRQVDILRIVEKIITITMSEDYLENLGEINQVKEYKSQIDQLVYKLYELTPEEITIVEGD